MSDVAPGLPEGLTMEPPPPRPRHRPPGAVLVLGGLLALALLIPVVLVGFVVVTQRPVFIYVGTWELMVAHTFPVLPGVRVQSFIMPRAVTIGQPPPSWPLCAGGFAGGEIGPVDLGLQDCSATIQAPASNGSGP